MGCLAHSESILELFWFSLNSLNPFAHNASFLYTLRFSDVFKGQRKEALGTNSLIQIKELYLANYLTSTVPKYLEVVPYTTSEKVSN